MKEWMKIPEATIWINSQRNGPPIEEHDIIRLINAGRLPASFEYEGILGIYEPGTPWFPAMFHSLRATPIGTFRFSGILEILDGCDLREGTERPFPWPKPSQGFTTHLVRIRHAWEPIPEDIPEENEIRPLASQGVTGTLNDVLIAYSDLVSCFPSLNADASPTAKVTSESIKRMKKEALLRKHKNHWPTIEEDFRHANEYGLRDCAKLEGHGYWNETAALQWAEERGKLTDTVMPESNPLDAAWRGVKRK